MQFDQSAAAFFHFVVESCNGILQRQDLLVAATLLFVEFSKLLLVPLQDLTDHFEVLIYAIFGILTHFATLCRLGGDVFFGLSYFRKVGFHLTDDRHHFRSLLLCSGRLHQQGIALSLQLFIFLRFLYVGA